MSNELRSNAAYIIQRTGSIYKGPPGKKALQKLVFLIQQKGSDMGYGYGLHFYGPYSSALDAELMSLCMDGVVDIDCSEYTHKLSVNDKLYSVESKLTPEDERMVDAVISHYSDYTPLELELLTTAVYAHEHLQDKSRPSVIAGVKKIKGEKFSDDKIEKAIDEFAYLGIDISR